CLHLQKPIVHRGSLLSIRKDSLLIYSHTSTKRDTRVSLCRAFWSQALEVALATMFAGACGSAKMARKSSSMELTLTRQALNSMDGSTEPTFFHLLPALDTSRVLTKISSMLV